MQILFYFISLTQLTSTVPPPRSSSRINEQASQLMLLSSLTAAALVSARNATAGASVMRSNSIPASAADLSIYRPKSTPPINPLITLDGLKEEDLPDATIGGLINSLTSPMSDGGTTGGIASKSRQQILEDRHQELLRKQRLLQEQYSKLQMLSRGHIPKGLLNELKKTGSESNIMSKSLPPSVFASTLNTDIGTIGFDGKDIMSQSTIGSGAHTISGGNINALLPHLKQQIMQHRTQQALLEQQLQQSDDALKMTGSNMVPLINGGKNTKAQQVDRSILAAAAAAAVMSNSASGSIITQTQTNSHVIVNNSGKTNGAHDQTSNVKCSTANIVTGDSCGVGANKILSINNKTNAGSPRRTNNSGGVKSTSASSNVNNSGSRVETQVYETDII